MLVLVRSVTDGIGVISLVVVVATARSVLVLVPVRVGVGARCRGSRAVATGVRTPRSFPLGHATTAPACPLPSRQQPRTHETASTVCSVWATRACAWEGATHTRTHDGDGARDRERGWILVVCAQPR